VINTQTDTQTTLRATSVATGRIYALRPENKIEPNLVKGTLIETGYIVHHTKPQETFVKLQTVSATYLLAYTAALMFHCRTSETAHSSEGTTCNKKQPALTRVQ